MSLLLRMRVCATFALKCYIRLTSLVVDHHGKASKTFLPDMYPSFDERSSSFPQTCYVGRLWLLQCGRRTTFYLQDLECAALGVELRGVTAKGRQ